jgi:hypothetical protein
VPLATEDVSRELLAWIRGVVPKFDCALCSVRTPAPKKTIAVRLVDLSHKPAPRGQGAGAILSVDYLITADLDDAEAENDSIAELMFAALGRHDWEVVPGQPADAFWLSLAQPRVLGFVLRCPLERTYDEKSAPLVRFPLQADLRGLVQFQGTVLTTDNFPIVNAAVSVDGSDIIVRTDRRGRFRLIQPGPRPQDPDNSLSLRVFAHGREAVARAKPNTNVTIRLAAEE